jgi:hypothetical protein
MMNNKFDEMNRAGMRHCGRILKALIIWFSDSRAKIDVVKQIHSICE